MTARWAWREVDLGALRHNVRTLASLFAPSELWAVVKADAYGHGAADVAHVAVEEGAAALCVALVREGEALRAAGITAPIVLLSEQPAEHSPAVLRAGLQPTFARAEAVEAFAAAARSAGATGVPVHVKIDTGMQRTGAPWRESLAVAEAVRAAAPTLRLHGASTHFAVADDPSHPFTAHQIARFDETIADWAAHGIRPDRIHLANSAGAIAHPRARRDAVRCGIAMYGVSPGAALDAAAGSLRPVLAVHARVSFVKRVEAGSAISYGLRTIFDRPTTVATVPIGYADGVPRRLYATGGELLVGGRRRRIVGVVTMDQLMVDVGEDDVAVGDDVVLIGRQGAERIRAEEWAERLGTIGYEIVCGFRSRLDRQLVGASVGPVTGRGEGSRTPR